MSFGQWLADKIDERGWTQQEAGAAFGVSHTTVGRWLAGSPPKYENLESIARGLRLDLEIVLKEARRSPYAGYDDLDEIKSRLVNLINEVHWTEEREESIRTQLEGFIRRDKKGRTQ